MCVSVRVAGCVWPWQWPQGVIYLQRLCPCSFYYTVALFAPPLLTEMTSKHSREHACMFVCVHLISGFGDTQEGGPFFQSHRHTTITEFLYSPSVCHHFHPVHSPPLSTSTDFKDAGSDATTCHRVFEERVHSPMACCTCCEADVFNLQKFCFKNSCASKISTRQQVNLYPL